MKYPRSHHALRRQSITVSPTNSFPLLQLYSNLTDDTITVDGVTLTLSNAADINGSSFYVENGGKLTLPSVTAYSSTAYFPGSVFEASDSGSLLSLPSLATIYRNYGIQITATSGGVVDLGALTSLATAGAGSADTASFTATGGGAIELPSSLTQLTVVSIKVDGNGTLPLSRFTSITNSSIEAVAGMGSGRNVLAADGHQRHESVCV